MVTEQVFRVVLASPSDVQAERDAAGSVIDSLNKMLPDSGFPAFLKLVRWETDAYPGLHDRGPQGLIDEQLRIEDCDILIGVFWRRFGTPVSDAESGTAHEIRRAIETWKERGTPQVMLYFREGHEQTISPDEEEQFRKVQNFKQQLCLTHRALVWPYEDDAAFYRHLHNHLWKVVMQRLRPRLTSGPLSFLRVSASADTVCARHESFTELMSDVFLRCTYDDDLPSPGPMYVTVELSASAPITSRILDRNVTEVVLFEVGRPGSATVIPGVNLGGPGAYGITFPKVHLGDIGPRETRVFQISNLRCDGTSVPSDSAGHALVFVYVTMTGAPIEDAQQIVATVKRGIEFEARSADNSGRLADSGFETSRSADLVEQRIATLRFTEGFVNAFKSRAPTFGRIWNTPEWNSVSNGESGSRCAVFAADKGAVQVAGLADSGTQLQAAFSNLPAGARIFVSAHQLGYGGYGGHARLLSPGGEAMMIGDVEARELPIQNGHALAVWEVVTPFYSERSAGFLDFGVFASYVSDPVANSPSIGTSVVFGGFSPQLAAYSSGGPIPMFSSTISTSFYNILTVVP